MKFFSLLYQGDVHTATDEKVIPAEDFSTLMEACEIVEKAKEDAVAYRQEAEAKCNVLFSEAEKAGFEAGLATFNEHILTFDQNLKRLRHEMQQAILPLA